MSGSPVNTGPIQAGQFKPGQSGNPTGKPKGTRHKTTLAVQALLEGEAETISRKAIELAKAGDMTAIRLVLERILPPRKDAPIQFDFASPRNAEDVANAMSLLVELIGAGDLTPNEGATIAGILEQQRKCIETAVLERKLELLEQTIRSRG